MGCPRFLSGFVPCVRVALQALEVARLVGVYKSAKETIAIENKHRAERLHQDLPPKISPSEIKGLQKMFESTEYELNPV